MPSAAVSDRIRWVGPAAGIVLAITAARILLLTLDQKQLFVDEAQYWFWGQDLAWGYFSKPPAIAWLIRAVTDLAGSDSPFWIRVPAPILQGITAMLLGGLAARLSGGTAAIWTIAMYLALPIVAVGSLVMTTDTLMFPFLVASYLLWTEAAEEERLGAAAVAGVALGLGFLAKYAAIYYAGTAVLAALLVPSLRPSWRVALSGLAGFVVVILPNLAWNVSHGFITLQHTVDNIDWARDPSRRLSLEWGELAEFLGAQLVAFGPLFLPVLVCLAFRWRQVDARMRGLVVFSVPILLLVCVQAVLSRAYANWAAAAYLTGTVAVVIWLLPRSRGWLTAGIVFNAALAVLIAVVVTLPPWLPPGVRKVTMDRYLGRVEMSETIMDLARSEGVDIIVSANREILADLFYTGRDAGLDFRAAPFEGRPPNHYAMHWVFEGSDAPVLFVGGEAPPCIAGEPPLAALAPDGYWSRRGEAAWKVPGTCWTD